MSIMDNFYYRSSKNKLKILRDNKEIYEIGKIENDIRREIFFFELSSMKNKTKIQKIQEIIKKAKNEINSYKQKIKGFNKLGFLIGLSTFHCVKIYKTKTLLSELNSKNYLVHMFGCLCSGFITGKVSGEIIGFNYATYKVYKKAKKNVDELEHLFNLYYNNL